MSKPFGQSNHFAVIAAAQRTPFGSFGGAFKSVSATELGVFASRAALAQAHVDPASVEQVIFGNVLQSSVDAIYLPRHIGLKAGVPIAVPALGVNRLCGSGFEAWVQACQVIMSGEAQVVLAGGSENMSQTPYVLRAARFGGLRMGPSELEDYMTAALVDSYSKTPMAITAENLAEKYHITREQADQYSLRSQTRYKTALNKGYFAQEITPVDVIEKSETRRVQHDEHPKPDVMIEKIASLKALFKTGGVVTAATASGITDGAAATLLMSGAEAQKRGVKVLARVLAWASVGCEPSLMGIGPALAIRKALARAELKLEQMDLVEVNEAFAAQYLAVEKELGLDPERTNVNGGAIAVGHPLGASGTRIMNHLVYELERRQARYAVGSACIGGGQGIAIVIERI